MPGVGLIIMLIALWLIVRAAAGGLPAQILKGFGK